MPLLSLFCDPQGRLWTEGVTLTRTEESDMAALEVRQGAPPEAGDADLLTPPRTSAETNLLIRAFSSLLRTRPRRGGIDMKDWLSTLGGYVTPEQLLNLTRALILLAAGFLLANLLGRLTRRLTAERLPQQQAQLARRLVYYLTLALFLIAGLHQLGFQLSVLLGAAGVLSVAVGFASQTSASNLVSGLFLIFEQPFQIGDVIQVGGTTGEVLSVDLLSVKLRTFDNIFVRLPNESLIKTEVRTLSRFPIRRADLQIGVDYSSDLELVRETLLEVADRNPLCLDEPAPLIIFQGFGDSSMNLQFSVWATRENYLPLKTGIQEEIKTRLRRARYRDPLPAPNPVRRQPHDTLCRCGSSSPHATTSRRADGAAPTGEAEE